MKMDDLYLDYNATSPVLPEVLEEMLPFFDKQFGNSVSVFHSFGWQAEKNLELSRAKVAKCLGIKNPHEVYFTSGATESNNWVFSGLTEALYSQPFMPESPSLNKKFHIITSSIEHASVLKSAQRLEKLNLADVTYLEPNSYGEIPPCSVLQAIRPSTKLISLFWVQNEVGSINDVLKISEISRNHQIYFHTDATQAIGKIPVDLKKVPVDLLSLSAHKFGGPKGVGLLYKKSNDPVVEISPMILGGGHELGQRSGTVNLPLIMGLTKAMELAVQPEFLSNQQNQWKNLQFLFWQEIQKNFQHAQLNGPEIGQRSPNNLNVTFKGYHVPPSIPGLAISRGSACLSGKWASSPTLRSLNISEDEAFQTLRFSMGPKTCHQDILQTIEILKKFIFAK